MTDSRSADDLVATIAEMKRDYGDKIDTLLARSNRRPVGTIEPTLRTTLAQYTLPLLGQAVSRTTYAELWEWAQTFSAVDGSIFGPGDGSTTFTLPDSSGRFIVGAGDLDTESYATGATGGQVWRALTYDELPSHDHGWGASWEISGAGSHSGHRTGNATVQSGAGGSVASSSSSDGGDHAHSLDFDLTIDPSGAGIEFDQRPPWLAALWVIWW